ncbi:MAG TPA: hypothetical protein VJ842_01225 [Pyrinomonadaceae bacterium]|nr:hypothetical protein [Pyrinomonadaceae bacterium]
MRLKLITHEDPQGFTLKMPEGWRVKTDGGTINVLGTNSERVTISPIKIEAQINANTAWFVLTNLSRDFWPHQKWEIPKRGWQFSPNGVRTVGSDESVVRQVNALWWANTSQGANGFFYGVAAPPARFNSLEPVFTRILQTFRVTRQGEPPASSNPLADMQFERWVDPTEMAFSIEVPAGWRVMGGVKRSGAISAKSEFIIQSPDNQVMARSGDVNLHGDFVEPSMHLMSLGMWEGMMTGGMLIKSYQSGLDFAAEYVKNIVARNAQNLQLLKSTDRQDYVNSLGWYAQILGWMRHTAGDVTYSCQFGNQQTYVIYQFADTAVTHFSDVATLWNLQTLTGFVAPADRASLADAVLQRAVQTFQMNPEWMQRQAQVNRRVAEDNRRYREYVSNLWQQTRDERWASWERITEQRGDALRGHTRVVDPETRQAYKVESGSSYYWIDPVRNVIAGTDIPSAPTWDFRAMLQTYD